MNNPPPLSATLCAVPSTYFFEHETTDLGQKHSHYAIMNIEEEELAPTLKLSAYVADGLRSWLPVTDSPQYYLAHIQDMPAHPPPLNLDLTTSRAAPISAQTLKAHINTLPKGDCGKPTSWTMVAPPEYGVIPLEFDSVPESREYEPRQTLSVAKCEWVYADRDYGNLQSVQKPEYDRPTATTRQSMKESNWEEVRVERISDKRIYSMLGCVSAHDKVDETDN